jgi:hypothetical protein
MLYVVIAHRSRAVATLATCPIKSSSPPTSVAVQMAKRSAETERPRPRLIGDKHGKRAEKIEPRSEEAEENGGGTREGHCHARDGCDGQRRRPGTKAALNRDGKQTAEQDGPRHLDAAACNDRDLSPSVTPSRANIQILAPAAERDVHSRPTREVQRDFLVCPANRHSGRLRDCDCCLCALSRLCMTIHAPFASIKSHWLRSR